MASVRLTPVGSYAASHTLKVTSPTDTLRSLMGKTDSLVFPPAALKLLPEVKLKDPVVRVLNARLGDIILYRRHNGSTYLRVVSSGTTGTGGKKYELQPVPVASDAVIVNAYRTIRYCYQNMYCSPEDPAMDQMTDADIVNSYREGELRWTRTSNRGIQITTVFVNDLKLNKPLITRLSEEATDFGKVPSGRALVVHDTNATMTPGVRSVTSNVDFLPLQSMGAVNVLNHITQPPVVRLLDTRRPDDHALILGCMKDLNSEPLDLDTPLDTLLLRHRVPSGGTLYTIGKHPDAIA